MAGRRTSHTSCAPCRSAYRCNALQAGCSAPAVLRPLTLKLPLPLLGHLQVVHHALHLQHKAVQMLWHAAADTGAAFWSQAGLQRMLHARTTTTATTSLQPASAPTDEQPPHPAHLAGELRAALLLEAGQQALLVVLASCSRCERHGPGQQAAVRGSQDEQRRSRHLSSAVPNCTRRNPSLPPSCSALRPCPPLVACSRRRASFLR